MTLTAFGPYAGAQSLDFAELERHSLFLIHGPTGSGKTSLLDGICFALYGTTSTGSRDPRDMRSHHADPNDTTEVTFEFSLGGEVYRITRSPQQERPKKRGAGTRQQPAAATLWRRTAAADSNDEGCVLATQPQKATEKVQELLGFREDQFRQVVLLPQGMFQTLLLAKSHEREAILETLFQTEVFRKIEEKLKESARGIEEKLRETRQVVRVLLEQSQSTSPDELRLRQKGLRTATQATQSRLQNLRESSEQAQARLREGERTVERIDRLHHASRHLAELEQRQGELAERTVELDLARRASTLLDAESGLEERRRELRDATRASEGAEQAVETAREVLERAEEGFRLEASREEERTDARKAVAHLEEISERVQGLDQDRRAVAEADAELRGLEAERGGLLQDHEAAEAEMRSIRASLDGLRAVASELDAREAALSQARKALTAFKDLGALRREVEGCRERLAAATQRRETQEAGLQDARLRAGRIEQDWLRAQAGALARQLAPGAPCPVCGSTEHPSPATAEEGAATESDLRAAREAVRSFEAERDRALAKETQAARALSERETALGPLRAIVEDRTAPELEEDVARLDRAAGDSRQARGRIQEASARLLEVEARERELRDRLRTVGETLVDVSGRKERARAILQERESRIPEELRTPDQAARAFTKARQRVRALEKALEGAEASRATARERLVARETERDSLRGAWRLAQERAAGQDAEFARRLTEESFGDAETFRSAKRSPVEMARLEAEIREHQVALRAAREEQARAAREAEGLEPPDLESLRSAVESSGRQLEEALGQLAETRRELEQVKQCMERIEKAERQSKALDSLYAVAGDLAEVASGRNPFRMSFQRFVLGALLDDVLRSASARLTTMSKHRFTLHRRRDQSDLRVSGGLDLEVFDAYSGRQRPVSTLSGGESFLASLSLALGLADVVQAYSGGVYLDTVFVDEGFGTLDSEALDLALRALVDLQAGGRMVGVISHVADLRERIDARLEVRPGRRGSSARFVIP